MLVFFGFLNPENSHLIRWQFSLCFADPGVSCHRTATPWFLTPLCCPPTPRHSLADFPAESYFDFFFRAPLNIALFSCSSTTLIKMKANAEVGGTQLNMDQKPCVMNDPYLGFFFSFFVSSMISINFKSILQVKLQPLECSLFDR